MDCAQSDADASRVPTALPGRIETFARPRFGRHDNRRLRIGKRSFVLWGPASQRRKDALQRRGTGTGRLPLDAPQAYASSQESRGKRADRPPSHEADAPQW